jgi:hypothetical protein
VEVKGEQRGRASKREVAMPPGELNECMASSSRERWHLNFNK